MDTKELICEFQRAIIEIYKQQSLTCLRGIDLRYIVNDRSILDWYSKTTENNAEKYGDRYSFSKILDDILVCSDELLYFTAHLYLYRPYINNPLKDRFEYNGATIYPNNQTVEANIFNMYVDITCQILYNYWGRIGDLIASFFPDLIEPKNVYFSSALAIIPKEYCNNENYLWLKKFNETDYLELNKMRKQVVHYTETETNYKYQYMEQILNEAEIRILQKERENIADFYKKHIILTIAGFEKTLLFFEEINPYLFPDTK